MAPKAKAKAPVRVGDRIVVPRILRIPAMNPDDPDDNWSETRTEQQVGELITSALDAIWMRRARRWRMALDSTAGLIEFVLRSSEEGWRLHATQ